VATREELERWFRAGLAAVDPHRATRRALEGAEPPRSRPAIIAIGKAAPGMATAATEWLHDRGVPALGGLVVSAHPAHDGGANLRWVAGDHPVPGAHSQAASDTLAALVDALPKTAPVLVFLSGGASALIAGPLPGLTAAEVTASFEALHLEGLDIHAMNRRRRAVTRWSAGRLAQALGPRDIRAWVISDVVGNDLATIGSGPLVDPTSRAPAIPHTIVADGEMAARAVAEAASAAGYAVVRHETPMVGEVAAVAERIHAALAGAPAVHVFHGEPVVRLPPHHGRGGRAQQLALHLAGRLPGLARILVAGTDGRDGPTDAAGAVVDQDTDNAIRRAGVDPDLAIVTCDAYPALDAVDALLRTGPTGTNVADLVIAAVA
jgi:hydroxypyruvate reductase